MDTIIKKTPVLLLSALATLGPLAEAALVVYEPFAQSGTSLNGQTGGTGINGNWSASGDIQFLPGSFSAGGLVTAGNRVGKTTATRFSSASADIGPALNGAGLLDEDAVIWFSAVMNSVGSGRSYLTIGTGAPDGFDRVGGRGGFGVGVKLQDGELTAHGWSDNSAVIGPAATVGAGPVLVVGRLSWAQVAGGPDYIDIYLPTGPGLVQPLTPASFITFDFDESNFTTLGFAGGANQIPEIDEIRFGTTYADVVPIPEPSAGGLLAVGLLICGRRRR